MKSNKIKFTSTDRVNGKLIKYRKGDCISIEYKNGKYLAVLVTGKFNKYYDFTLLDYYNDIKPTLNNFMNGKFFGTRYGSWGDLTFAVDRRMIKCRYIDGSREIEVVGNLELIENLGQESYAYVDNLTELHTYYLDQILIRVEKTRNAEKFLNLAFANKHLVDIKCIIREN